jgi:hypothetical protein
MDGIWSEHDHVFSCQHHAIPRKKKSTTLKLGPPGRVRHNVLGKHYVEFLIVDGIGTHLWEPWLKAATADQRPSVIIIFSEGKDLSTERNVVDKQFRKQMGRWDYHMTYWTLGA